MLKGIITKRHEELVKSKGFAVKLQEEGIVSKKEQLQSIRSSVSSPVQETVETEIMTFSGAVANQTVNSTQVVAQETLTTVVRSIVEHDDNGGRYDIRVSVRVRRGVRR